MFGYVIIVGGGVVGINVVKMVMGLGVKVIILDVLYWCLMYLDDVFFGCLIIMMSSEVNLCVLFLQIDLFIGVVFILGVKVLNFVICDMLGLLELGLVIVDVVIDQGGCVEMMYFIIYDELIYLVDDIVYYGVVNMFGVVLCILIFVLMNVIFFYVFVFVEYGLGVFKCDLVFVVGFNIYQGKVICVGVVDVFGLSGQDVEVVLV